MTPTESNPRPELPPAERQLLEQVGGPASPALVLRTQSRVDVGHWFRDAPLWCACLADRLVLFARGRRPHRETIAYADLQRSRYNFLTGELALAPAPAAGVRQLKLAPLEASRVLEQINRKEHSHA